MDYLQENLDLLKSDDFLGIGCDIEKTDRFIDKSKVFLDKIYTPQEQTYCLSKPNPHLHFAGRYCAKEAVVKALYSADITGVHYKDIEVFHNDKGVPQIRFHSNLPQNVACKVSISHSPDHAMAFAVITCKK